MIQVIEKSDWQKEARSQHWARYNVFHPRGTIFDRASKPVAISAPRWAPYVTLSRVKEPDLLARQLASILNVPVNSLKTTLTSSKGSYVPLMRKIDFKKAQAIKNLRHEALTLEYDPERFYPREHIGSQLIGLGEYESQRGIEGIEKQYNQYLEGIPGLRKVVRAASQSFIPSLTRSFNPPGGGYSVILTIDESLQYEAERALQKVFQNTRAKNAMAIAMDPQTGEILALALRPTFNPNHRDSLSPETLLNRAVASIFEPGSSFKPIVFSAALQEGVITPKTTIDCKNGQWPFHGHVLNDVHPYSLLSASDVLTFSSNIGTIQIALLLGKEKLYEYIKAFGFGSPTGIALPGEVRGLLRPPEQWSDNSIGALPIGQEIGVSGIQLLCAYACIANDGLLMKPLVAKAVIGPHGQTIETFSPIPTRQVISQDTARLVTHMLQAVVEKGTGKKAQIPGYTVAGKTGTAQKIDPATKRYSKRDYIAIFAGFVPATNPSLALIVAVDSPRGTYWGGEVAAPVFAEIARAYLLRRGIPPDQTLLPEGLLLAKKEEKSFPRYLERESPPLSDLTFKRKEEQRLLGTDRVKPSSLLTLQKGMP